MNIEAFLLVSALSLDAFLAAFAYGTNNIKIPIKSTIVINLICSTILGLGLIIGNLLSNIIPATFTSIICFLILLILSISKFFDYFIKKTIKKYQKIHCKKEFEISNLHIMLQIVSDATKADIDKSKILSIKEASLLALALSLDGLAAGIGSGMTDFSHLTIFLASLITDVVAVILGAILGKLITSKTDLNLTWISGLILLLLALSKLIL